MNICAVWKHGRFESSRDNLRQTQVFRKIRTGFLEFYKKWLRQRPGGRYIEHRSFASADHRQIAVEEYIPALRFQGVKITAPVWKTGTRYNNIMLSRHINQWIMPYNPV